MSSLTCSGVFSGSNLVFADVERPGGVAFSRSAVCRRLESWTGRARGLAKGLLVILSWAGVGGTVERLRSYGSVGRNWRVSFARLCASRLARRRKSPSLVICARSVPERWMNCVYL